MPLLELWTVKDMPLERGLVTEGFTDRSWQACGLTADMLFDGVRSTYGTLDMIDAKMLESDLPRLSGLVELVNFSSMIGNLLAAGIVRASNGMFKRAGPHKYQDLRSNAPGSPCAWITPCRDKDVVGRQHAERSPAQGRVLLDVPLCIGRRGRVVREGTPRRCRLDLGDTFRPPGGEAL